MLERTIVERVAPDRVEGINLEPRGNVFPSPTLWKDHVFYQILPDRFSDGRESARPTFDRDHPEQFRAHDKQGWMAAGLRFNGGTLKGVLSKLDYLQGLGVTGLWLNPSFKQRRDLQTYHGYGLQDFLDIDPRFGTLQDLRDLVDAAHARGMVVLLDIVIDHTANNWFYGPDLTNRVEDSLPYRYSPPYSFGGWRSGTGECIPEIQTRDDGCWPRELQRLEAYHRSGSIGNWGSADPMDPNAEFRRGDFFDLKKLNEEDDQTLKAIIRCYQFWIALSDCDGFRIDAAKHIPKHICQRFCFAIFGYAQSIGKDNFLLVGEITDLWMSVNYLSLLGNVFDRALGAVLDINNSPDQLTGVVRGTLDAAAYFGRFRTDTAMSGYIQTGRAHVTVLDDHDMSCRSHKARFAANNATPHHFWQVAHAAAALLTVPGIPCLYYGTEQAFDGNEGYHDYAIEPQRFGEDRYIRESMFGGPFGAFQTSGCHFFNPEHPSYLRIAAIARLRKADDPVGRALRKGICHPREASVCGGSFRSPAAGELCAWSRILSDHEVVMVLNTHGLESRGAEITVDAGLHPHGSRLSVRYRADWTDAELKNPPTGETFEVHHSADGRATVHVELPPAGMVILK